MLRLWPPTSMAAVFTLRDPSFSNRTIILENSSHVTSRFYKSQVLSFVEAWERGRRAAISALTIGPLPIERLSAFSHQQGSRRKRARITSLLRTDR